MGSIVVINFMSLDGVVQAPLRADEDTDGGFRHGGWTDPYQDETVGAFMGGATTRAAGLLLGRRTYENFVTDWMQPDATEPAIVAMNRMPKYLVSQTLTDPVWQNTIRLGADLPAEVARLRAEVDGEIVVFGSTELVRALHRADLVGRVPAVDLPAAARRRQADVRRRRRPGPVRARRQRDHRLGRDDQQLPAGPNRLPVMRALSLAMAWSGVGCCRVPGRGPYSDGSFTWTGGVPCAAV
ncbi:dihydrofolate reductase family protein [Microlunatus parietis]|uniref:Dihydrofolate reductase n=1 Tax=Microlunatus parietis TaxID=682979 RepID=A0A7Y9I246_9ACTN|nr:dihydrofolate reductase family protein [Microlunatus parietis]NYE68783.1 dihydrofolate reductase [Microlunatus parietis]